MSPLSCGFLAVDALRSITGWDFITSLSLAVTLLCVAAARVQGVTRGGDNEFELINLISVSAPDAVEMMIRR